MAIPKNPYKFTPEAQERALRAVREHGYNPATMAEVAGVSYRTILRYMEDEDFAARVQEARWAWGRQVIIPAMIEQGVEGVMEERLDKDGNVVSVRRHLSPQVLLFLAKKNLPDFYGDSPIKIEKTVTGKVEHEHSGRVDVAALPPDKQRAVRVLLAREEPSEN